MGKCNRDAGQCGKRTALLSLPRKMKVKLFHEFEKKAFNKELVLS